MISRDIHIFEVHMIKKIILTHTFTSCIFDRTHQHFEICQGSKHYDGF